MSKWNHKLTAVTAGLAIACGVAYAQSGTYNSMPEESSATLNDRTVDPNVNPADSSIPRPNTQRSQSNQWENQGFQGERGNDATGTSNSTGNSNATGTLSNSSVNSNINSTSNDSYNLNESMPATSAGPATTAPADSVRENVTGTASENGLSGSERNSMNNPGMPADGYNADGIRAPRSDRN